MEHAITQFLETQTIFTVGWIIASFIWQVIVINNIGGLQAPLAPLSFLLSTNAIAQTVVRSVTQNTHKVTIFFKTLFLFRSVFDSLRSLASRLLITLFVFGYDVTVKLLFQKIKMLVFIFIFLKSFLVSLKMLIHFLLVTSYLIPLFWLLQLEEP